MKKLVSVLGIACMVVTSILLCGQAYAFYDDFESDTVGNEPANWTTLWQPLTVADNDGVLWTGKFVCGPANNEDDQAAIVTDLVLGDCRIEVDHVSMGNGLGMGGSGLVLLRCQGNRGNALYLNFRGDSIYFHWKIDNDWGPALGTAGWSDGQNHYGANAHVVIVAQGEYVDARATLINNPSVYAQSVVDLPGLWLQGNVGLDILGRPNPPSSSGFDNFRAEPLAGRLTGYIDLEDYTVTRPGVSPVEIEFVPVSGGEARTEFVQLDPNNINFNYSVAQVKAGTYNIYYGACKWLRKMVANVVLTDGATTVQDASLKNGDVDGDHEVSTTDLSVLLRNVGQTGN